MQARLHTSVQRLAESFWVLPAAIVLVLAGLGAWVVDLQHTRAIPSWLPSDWVYGGGETGARTLLGAIASSTIAVAGTLFSITIAALTLASSQMGPRLLRNFMQDRGNQATLGVLLGTFAYALVVLRSVRGGDEDAFVPALGVTVGLALAAGCIAALVYFVHHVASRINVDTVIDLVHADLEQAIHRLPAGDAAPPTPPAPLRLSKGAAAQAWSAGYLEQIDANGLAAWAAEHDTHIRLLAGRGQFVFPGAPIATSDRAVEGFEEAVRAALALARGAAPPVDLMYLVRQLVEVALRALSPSMNDPNTAMNVIDRLGAALALLATRNLPNGVVTHAGQPRLQVPATSYDDLTEAMFGMIRQSARGAPSVLSRLLTVLTRVAEIEPRPDRREALRRTAGDIMEEGLQALGHPRDRAALRRAHRAFLTIAARPPNADPPERRA